MRNRPIHWSEGMFLRPQHFQAADQYWEERISTSGRFDNIYGYGIFEVKIDEAALTHYQLEIQGCKARLKDGSIISFDSSHIDRLDLKDGLQGPEDLNQKFVENDAVTVYLAVPQLVEARANVSHVDSPSQTRYIAFEKNKEDESAGGSPQELSFRDFNFRIMLSTEDRAGYECLPLCRIKRSPKGDGTAVLDPEYFPPVLRTNAWDSLHLGIIRPIYDLLVDRMEHQARICDSRNISFSTQEAGDAEKLLFLRALNESVSMLTNYAFIDGIHPLTTYQSLCEIIGRLSIFSESRSCPEFPNYDHDDLATIYRWAYEQIKLLIYKPGEELYEQRYFIGSGPGLQVALEPKWFNPSEWDWYIGVDPGSTSPQDCFTLLSTGKIDWKIGSMSSVHQAFGHMISSIALQPIKQKPTALPSRGNWVYFTVDMGRSPGWKEVESSNTMAIRIREDQIHNRGSLQGARKIQILADNKIFGIEFAVFAVRKRL